MEAHKLLKIGGPQHMENMDIGKYEKCETHETYEDINKIYIHMKIMQHEK